ncbi:MAG: helix-turn-helix transcriptional regulator [Bdellovibrionota bacterium]
MINIGQRMKQFRVNAGLSIAEVATAASVPVSTYREWENGRQIQGEPYAKISQALNITLYELLTGQKPKSLDVLHKISEMERLCQDLRKHLQSLIDG